MTVGEAIEFLRGLDPTLTIRVTHFGPASVEILGVQFEEANYPDDAWVHVTYDWSKSYGRR